MRTEPEGLPAALLAEAFRDHWGIQLRGLEYVPLGAGSHHWLAEDVNDGRWFVTADNLQSLGTQDGEDAGANFDGLHAAFRSAVALREAGLDFAVAPIRNKFNEVVLRILPDWSVAVFPFIDGIPAGAGEWTDADQHDLAARLIGQLHSMTPPRTILKWEPGIPHRSVLLDALHDLGEPWLSGPYAERARQLLGSTRRSVEALLSRYDDLVQKFDTSQDSWVVTHGEPHSANFLSTKNGRMLLIDWDTVRLGPRERDLAILIRSDPRALASYQSEAGAFAPRPEVMELFRTRWTVADICVYTRSLRNAHGASEDDAQNWERLRRYLREMG